MPLPWRCLATVVVALAVACGPVTTRQAGPPPPALPADYQLYDGGKLGFRFGLAPGWQQTGDPAPDGANFTDPSRQAALLVHVGRARSPDLAVATGAALVDLTHGAGASGGSESAAALARRPARLGHGAV